MRKALCFWTLVFSMIISLFPVSLFAEDMHVDIKQGKESLEVFEENRKATGSKQSFPWETVMDFPSSSEIEYYNKTSTNRSPFVSAWLKAGGMGRYTEYAIDFKADYLPDYTYCCLCQFSLDYSSLKSQYTNVRSNEAASGYAGFQYLGPGKNPIAILSFWDIICEDKDGRIVKTQPTRLYPEDDNNMTFTGEGEGVHCLTEYEWKPGKWYRMLLQCGTSEKTGNTTVEQWVQDLESKRWTLLSKYDLDVKNAAFINDNAVFLENFNPGTSGEVRTMEIKNVRIHLENKTNWDSIREGYFSQSFDYPGSYKYGTNDDVFWLISTGVSNKAGKLDKGSTLKVSGGESTRPY